MVKDANITPRQLTKDDESFSLSFNTHKGNAILSKIAPAGLISTEIFKAHTDINYNIFVTEFIVLIQKYMNYIGMPHLLKKKNALFSLNKNYSSLLDIEYYELYMTGFTPQGGSSDFYIRFYLDQIKPSFEYIKQETRISALSDKQFYKFTALACVYYKDIEAIVIPFLAANRGLLNNVLETSVDAIDNRTVDVLNMLMA